MDYLKLTEDRLSVDEILKLVSSEKCGAVSMFVGTTRDNFEGKEVKRLEYEAYEPMALKVMKSICCMIREKWDQVHNIAIHHRTGTVPVLEASVVIAISSPHRMDSIAAVQYCIENLKVSEMFDEPDKILVDSRYLIDQHLVQINASHVEMKNRIKKYTDRKREQINMNNIKDFIKHDVLGNTEAGENYSSCARVDAILQKSKDSKGHLKVLKTFNEWGPQTKIEKIDGVVTDSVSKSAGESIDQSISGIEERIVNAENRINVSKPISSDIYSRLKLIEDRLSELESISPEYSIFWSKKNKHFEEDDAEEQPKKKLKFSSEDILNHMKLLEKK